MSENCSKAKRHKGGTMSFLPGLKGEGKRKLPFLRKRKEKKSVSCFQEDWGKRERGNRGLQRKKRRPSTLQ